MPNGERDANDLQYINPYGNSTAQPVMKTTLNLDDTLLTQAKTLAAHQRTSLTRLIEEGLQLRLRVEANPSATHAASRLPRTGRTGGGSRRIEQQGALGRRGS